MTKVLASKCREGTACTGDTRVRRGLGEESNKSKSYQEKDLYFIETNKFGRHEEKDNCYIVTF